MNGVIHLTENIEKTKSLFSISPPAPSGEYCDICGDELQKYIICGNARYSPCSCIKIKLEKERQIDRERQIDKKRRRSNIPAMFINSGFDNFEIRKGTEIAYKSLKNYTEKYETYSEQGFGFVLIGNTGSGKSRLACTVANELINQNRSVIYFNVSELYDDVNSNFGQLPEEIYRSKLIILDDFGVDKTTNSKETTLYKIIEYRTRNLLPTILTTNIPQKDWELYIEARALSRLGANVQRPEDDRSLFKKITISSTDFRRGI